MVAALPSWVAGSQDSPARRPTVTHVRPIGLGAAYTLARGRALSPTLRRLVDQLQHSDLIVYVAEERRATGHSDAAIQFMHAAGGIRFVRISLETDLMLPQRVSLLGHELQHALEVAAASEIRDRESFLRYYDRLGVDGRDHFSLDSQAARDAEERIRQELAVAIGVR